MSATSEIPRTIFIPNSMTTDPLADLPAPEALPLLDTPPSLPPQQPPATPPTQRPPQQQRQQGQGQQQQRGNNQRHQHNRNQQPRQQQGQQQQRGNNQPRPQPDGAAQEPRNGLKLYPFGGFEQVGRNCFCVEVDGDMHLIDLGLQFPDEDMLGIDYLVPDFSSIKGRENRIKAVLFTHGHLDHIGAVQHVLPQLHFPPCFGTKLTMAFVRKRLDEEHLTSKSQLNTVEYGKRIRIGKIEVEWLHVTHSIPDSSALAIYTPYGTIVHTGDFKFDLTPMNEEPADFQRLAELGKQGVLAIIADSTNASKPGNSKSEKEISETLDGLIRDAKGRVIISTFSSLLNRLQQAIEHAKKYNRKVFISGRSMDTNIEIAQQLGYLQAPRGLIRKMTPAVEKLPDREVLILTTGSQGEEQAGLARMGLGTHRHISVKRGDTVILSSNPILGNERAVAKVINNLHLKGAIVKTNQELALHVTGHGHQNDILLMHRLVRAKHVIPEHGEPHMLAAHGNLVRSIGYQDNQIHLLTNGEILEFDNQGNARRSKHKISIRDVIIDGRGAAGEGQRVLTDRKVMSTAGMIMVLFRCYSESRRLVGDPEVISRGLLYGSEQQEITTEIAAAARKAYEEELARGETDRSMFKRAITGALYRYFDRKLDREPMVVPIIVEV